MSTNKSEHYRLHLWEADDDFLRNEFNENFAAIDEAVGGKAEVVIGSYTGNDEETQDIELGFRPRVLFVSSKTGRLSEGSWIHGGMFTQFSDPYNYSVRITDTGFQVLIAGYSYTNRLAYSPHSYVAIP